MPGSFSSRTVVVSRVSSAAAGLRRRPAVPASAIVVRKRRRVCIVDIGTLPFVYESRLQLRVTSFKKCQSVPSAMMRLRTVEVSTNLSGLDARGASHRCCV